jgi:hypothetical protein
LANGAFAGVDETKLLSMGDVLRNNMDAAEYKHVVLGLIFLKYISDAFEAKHTELEQQRSQGADPEDPDEYRAASIFWVPKEARWAHLKTALSEGLSRSMIIEEHFDTSPWDGDWEGPHYTYGDPATREGTDPNTARYTSDYYFLNRGHSIVVRGKLYRDRHLPRVGPTVPNLDFMSPRLRSFNRSRS